MIYGHVMRHVHSQGPGGYASDLRQAGAGEVDDDLSAQ